MKGGFILLVLAIGLASAQVQINVTSPAFAAGGMIPAKFTCGGGNTSPALEWHGVPNNAKTLALIVDDPDAPGGLFTHWLLWNIPPTTTSIGESGSAGTVGKNDFGKSGYGGPCPPSGTHRYIFKIFALDASLNLAPGAKRKELDAAMKGHVVGQGELIGKYSKK